MSTPPSTNLTPEMYALGDVQAEYTGANLLVSGLVLAVLCAIGTIIWLALWFVVGVVFYIGFLAPIGMVVGLVTAVRGLINGRRRALVFKDGIAEVRRGGVTTMRWDDVTAVSQKIATSTRILSQQGAPRISYILTSPTAKLVIEDYKGIQQLGSTIHDQVGRRLGPRLMEAYNRGESVQFGKITLSKAGLDIGQGAIAWPQVEQVQLSMGKIAVRRNGQWTEVYGQPAAQTPNLNLLLTMVGQITGAQQK